MIKAGEVGKVFKTLEARKVALLDEVNTEYLRSEGCVRVVSNWLE